MYISDVLELIQPRNSVAGWHQERSQPRARSRISAGHWNKPWVFIHLPLPATWLQAFMSVLDRRPVPAGLVAPLGDPISGSAPCFQHRFSGDAVSLPLYQLRQLWTLWWHLLLQPLVPSPRHCHFTPGGAHLFPREATCALQCLSVLECVSGNHFSRTEKASLAAGITTLLPTCCVECHVYIPCDISELNAATSGSATVSASSGLSKRDGR